MANNNCLPGSTYVAAMTSQNDCPDGCTDCDQCNCSMNDILWTSATSECMSKLGVGTGNSLEDILTIVFNNLCNVDELDCSDIIMAASYPNIGYYGTEDSCQYNMGGEISSGVGAIVIDGTTHSLGTVSSVASLLIALNGLGKGVFTLNGYVITALGYHSYGVLSVGDVNYTPVCADTDNKKTLCDFAAAIDNKIGDIDETINNLDFCQCPNVLYNDNTDTAMPSGGTQTLKTYTVPSQTMKTNGDKIIAETYFLCVAISPSASYTLSLSPSLGTTSVSIANTDDSPIMVRITETISRKSNTTLSIKKDINRYNYPSGAIIDTSFFYQEVSGLDLDNTPFDIKAVATGVQNGVTCKYLQVDILRA